MKVRVLEPVFAESANRLVNKAGTYKETILLKKDHWVVDAKSMLGVLAISLQTGQEVEITVFGGDKPNEYETVINDLLQLGLFEKA